MTGRENEDKTCSYNDRIGSETHEGLINWKGANNNQLLQTPKALWTGEYVEYIAFSERRKWIREFL